MMSSTWICAEYLTPSHVASLSLNWRDMNLMKGLVGGLDDCTQRVVVDDST